MVSKRLIILFWVFFIHLAGMYLFIRGLLLARLSLSEHTTCSTPESCALPRTHKRAILLIIDALRFDFISPDPPIPASPFHHNILTLPRELTKSRPKNSLIYNAYADPPTTTLQRIKALTTGSLPTYIDLRNNFGGSLLEEDSILKQLRLAGKKVGVFAVGISPSTYQKMKQGRFHRGRHLEVSICRLFRGQLDVPLRFIQRGRPAHG